MRRTWMVLAVIVLAAAVLAAGLDAAQKKPQNMGVKAAEVEKVRAALPEKATAAPKKARKLLIFNLCRGFRHGSIPIGAKAIELMGEKTGAYTSVSTLDPEVFRPQTLRQFDAVVFNNTTGTLFEDEALKKSLLAFIASGRGIVGVHAATDCFYKWAEFGKMMGGYFSGHPWHEDVGVKLDDPSHPLLKVFGDKGFRITDEIYQFKDPYSRDNLRVLLSLDMNATRDKGKRPDKDFAVSWIREVGKGRLFYCSLGHRNEIFWNPSILKYYLDGIQYALGDIAADATPSARLSPAPKAAPAPQKKADAAPMHVKVYAAPKADGWIPLFDGKDTTAWQKPAADKWTVEDGILTWQKGCRNIWTKEKFGDFILDLEFKTTKGTNSGIFLRSAEGEKNWLHGSIEIQISSSYGPDRKPGKHDCGSVYDIQAPAVAAEKPVGEWNRMVIAFKGNLLKIVLNDKPIIDINLDNWTEAHKNFDGSKNKFKTAYKDMAKVGHLGLQDHGRPVWYRNVKVKPLK